uniref:Solute carrier family 45 member 4b n=1 Tax=Oncorhynchus mykiss TaxID=8022 RepID=A0A8K9XNQ2_ONCMY
LTLLMKKQSSERDEESPDGSLGEGAGGERIPLRKWVMHGAVMFGREFCYAMETALVTPVLLQIGLPEQYYSLTWFLSPILGLILTPLIGSASDRCTLKWGRRRPFILALCVGVLLGVSLFLNGSLLGDSQPIGIVLTVLGVVLLDFSADASDGPIRAYLLDVADTEEQDMALNIHAFSAGLGGAVGYVLGGLDWTSTILGTAFKSQEQILFVFAAVIFTISVILHMFSIKEESFEARGDTLGEGDSDSLSSSEKLKGGLAGPRSVPQLDVIGEEDAQSERELFINVDRVRSKSDSVLGAHVSSTTLSSGDSERDDGDQGGTTVKLLWLSMLKMPPQLLRLCVCHLLTWFSIIAEAVFYTDFMGQVIYAGDPTAPANSTDLQNYHKGVQMGCWGLVVYAATAAVCSAVLQKYLDNYDLSIKVIYILGTLSFSLGTAVMAIFPNVYVAMVMISTMGIISMSISYCPYALLGQYHENKQVRITSRRGFGIDCAILSCQVYIAQILVASALSTVVDAVGSVLVIPMMASGGSFLVEKDSDQTFTLTSHMSSSGMDCSNEHVVHFLTYGCFSFPRGVQMFVGSLITSQIAPYSLYSALYTWVHKALVKCRALNRE